MSMFKKWFGGKSSDPSQAPIVSEETTAPNFFSRLKKGLSKTRKIFSEGLAQVFLGRKTLDAELIDEIETVLLSADVGVEVCDQLISNLTEGLNRQTLKDPGMVMASLKSDLLAMAKKVESPWTLSEQKPFVILVVGVNGAGKTTTIGKLTKRFQSEGKSVLLAAGDTFRAAAVDQLRVWGERNQVVVISGGEGADSASVIYDAFHSAKAKKIDVVIADTAGRLHNKSHLMAELSKVKKVMSKLDPSAPHEVMLVLDAGNGQNALVQAQEFHQKIGVTGITLTKLDGTAKGGILFAIAEKLALPIRFIGIGENIEDLQAYSAQAFVDGLFAEDND